MNVLLFERQDSELREGFLGEVLFSGAWQQSWKRLQDRPGRESAPPPPRPGQAERGTAQAAPGAPGFVGLQSVFVC